MKLLELFEKDSFRIVEKIKFGKINCEFQDKLNSDIKDITSSRKHRLIRRPIVIK